MRSMGKRRKFTISYDLKGLEKEQIRENNLYKYMLYVENVERENKIKSFGYLVLFSRARRQHKLQRVARENKFKKKHSRKMCCSR